MGSAHEGDEGVTSSLFISCRACAGEGRILRGHDVDYGRCRCCDGTGIEEIEAEPIEMEDLEEMAGP